MLPYTARLLPLQRTRRCHDPLDEESGPTGGGGRVSEDRDPTRPPRVRGCFPPLSQSSLHLAELGRSTGTSRELLQLLCLRHARPQPPHTLPSPPWAPHRPLGIPPLPPPLSSAMATMTGLELLHKVFTDEPVCAALASRVLRVLTHVADASSFLKVLSPEAVSCESDFNAHVLRFPNDTNWIATRSPPGTGYGCVSHSLSLFRARQQRDATRDSARQRWTDHLSYISSPARSLWCAARSSAWRTRASRRSRWTRTRRCPAAASRGASAASSHSGLAASPRARHSQ